MISVTVALLNGQAVVTDVDFNAFTTIGSLQNVVANNLGCLRDDVVLAHGHTTPSRVSILSQIGLSGCVSLVAILRCRPPHAKTTKGEYGAFAFLKCDGSVVTWGDGVFGGNSEKVKEAYVSYHESIV